ncbi:MAG: hypothetical protein ACXW27_12200 [Allosphingosinicella sp.]
MLLGIGILAAALVAGVWAVLVRHWGWGRVSASLAAFAICPLLWLAYVFTIEDPVAGGMALLIGLPIAILDGFAGVGLAIVGREQLLSC